MEPQKAVFIFVQRPRNARSLCQSSRTFTSSKETKGRNEYMYRFLVYCSERALCSDCMFDPKPDEHPKDLPTLDDRNSKLKFIAELS